jgi:adenylate kinase family enzyme
MGSLIVLSGPVGAGKTTVASALAANATSPTILIEGDMFWKFVVKEKGGERHEDFRAAMRAMLAAGVSYARSDYETILDFSIPPAFIKRAAERLREIELHYVVLLPPLSTCEARAASRREGRISDYGSYRDFYADFQEAAATAIADDHDDPVATAARIREGIGSGAFRFALDDTAR